MKNIYVTELTFAGKDTVKKSWVVSQHGHDGWTANDIYDLLDDMDDTLSYFGTTAPLVDISIVDRHALAQWVSDSDIVKYNNNSTVVDTKPEFSYEGEDYNMVFLLREVLSDFITDRVESSLINKDIVLPSGIELDD